MLLRSFLITILAVTCLVAPPRPARAEIVLEDGAGRTVHLAAAARRIVTNDSLLLLSLAMLEPDPVSRIAGWAAPYRIDAGIMAAYRARFPAIDDIPTVGGVVPTDVTAEALLGAAPDLVVIGIWGPGWDAIAAKLDEAGVPVIFLEGERTAAQDPGEATASSLVLLGRSIGHDDRGREVAEFIRSRYREVARRLAGVTERRTVLLDVHAGTLCCYTPGSGNRISRYIELAGGHGIGADVVPGYDGQIGIEYALTADPYLYVGTGSPHLAAQGGLTLGGGIDVATARASLQAVTSRHLLGGLPAVVAGRAHAVSHQMAITPLNVLVLECLAKWLHPAVFEDIDPARTLAEINRRFMAVPVEGTFWIDLVPPAPDRPQ